MSYLKYCPECKIGQADLHIHTSASDGYYTPLEIIELAQKKGLQSLAITDHDTTAGLAQIEQSHKPRSVNIISGIELSTEYEGQEIHILGYSIAGHNKKLQNTIKILAEARKDRVFRIVKRLQEAGFMISVEDIKTRSLDVASLGRPHVALILLEKGYVNSISEAFDKYLTKGRPGYVPRYRIRPHEAIELVLGAGGIPVLAHPGCGVSMEILPFLIKNGLQGIEVFYPQHTDKMQMYYYDIAKKNGLLITGGSDFHGHEKEEDSFFGNIPIPSQTISRLKAEQCL